MMSAALARVNVTFPFALYTTDTDFTTLPCGLIHLQSKIHLT